VNLFFQILSAVGQLSNVANTFGLPPKGQMITGGVLSVVQVLSHLFAQAAPSGGALVSLVAP
jgi:hypothetical protein